MFRILVKLVAVAALSVTAGGCVVTDYFKYDSAGCPSGAPKYALNGKANRFNNEAFRKIFLKDQVDYVVVGSSCSVGNTQK